ncbi:MAG: hypothetical protein R3E95_23475 [Thiolinea sp.]
MPAEAEDEATSLQPMVYRHPAHAWRMANPEGNGSVLYPAMLDSVLQEFCVAYSVWWTEGSDQLPSSRIITQGHHLSPVGRRCWTAAGAPMAGSSREICFYLCHILSCIMSGRESRLPPLTSYAVSHTGNVRDHNEDSFLVLEEQGLWVVADGAGGHSRGEVASQLIAWELQRFRRQPAFV